MKKRLYLVVALAIGTLSLFASAKRPSVIDIPPPLCPPWCHSK
jgi:hypothetical protein